MLVVGGLDKIVVLVVEAVPRMEIADVLLRAKETYLKGSHSE